MRDFLRVGQITNTHGVRGEVKVLPLTDDMRRFDDLDYVYINRKEVKIENVKYLKDKDMNIIYKNSNVYIGDEKASFSIVEISKDILIDSDDKYNLVLLKTKSSLSDGEIVELTFNDKRISLFKIYDVIWKG